ncbi:MAG: shikimate dehydrogenase [Candidatus Marinimicrobia bacterium]|nr:shikimate dehydrogenase [Candidatus Neomarinimicrobiota bacterium]MBT4359434.1 shikimate dehydrogenase [Candidatus Neomarinimicrobiota bacterium]MBT4715964.1 shikimate dehydrogenase [Candidatus Neomarinimicrobiota bacterium]MBT4948103.1 shikimate dehydrogenase [Candidatus Neomarinimicrobiota bacterium]MBT5270985.1 shikimate dehydrogenase [Candidatus Neomarinimicrobiota bacterium]
MKLAVIGDPLRQSVSDFMHGWIYEQLGLEAEYKKIKVVQGDLERWVNLPSARKLDGFNVTIPHKEDIIPFLDSVNDRTAPIGAVNCVRRHDGKLTGYNTDWYGFVKSLEAAGVDLAGKKVVVLGSGGAARAITFGLARVGAGKTTVIARDPDRAKTLIKDMSNSAEGMKLAGCSWDESAVEPIEDAYCLVNCTPIGMKPKQNESPLDGDLLESIDVVVDTIFNPLNTRLLSEAIFSDCQTVSGLDMYLYQAMASIDVWFGPQDWNQIKMNEMREAVHNKITGFKRKFE